MTRDEIRQAVEFFLDVVLGDLPVEEREENLYLALDRLALAIHFADYIFDETDYPEVLLRDYAALREIVVRNFPNLGLYNVVLDINENIGAGEVAVGDAIDDICDITGEMEEVIWCWENTSVDDAL
jgi:hypothetical protein